MRLPFAENKASWPALRKAARSAKYRPGDSVLRTLHGEDGSWDVLQGRVLTVRYIPDGAVFRVFYNVLWDTSHLEFFEDPDDENHDGLYADVEPLQDPTFGWPEQMLTDPDPIGRLLSAL